MSIVFITCRIMGSIFSDICGIMEFMFQVFVEVWVPNL